MPIEITTKLRMPSIKQDRPAEVIMELVFIPRGSGNRNKARRWAEAFRSHPVLGPHVRKVVAGSTKVTVHLEAGFATYRALEEMRRQGKEDADLPGQLPLFSQAS